MVGLLTLPIKISLLAKVCAVCRTRSILKSSAFPDPSSEVGGGEGDGGSLACPYILLVIFPYFSFFYVGETWLVNNFDAIFLAYRSVDFISFCL